MRELIIGASGLVGSHLLASAKHGGGEVLGTYHTHADLGLVALDLNDEHACDDLLRTFNPGTVYLPAAIVNTDWVEQHPAESGRVNVEGPLRLIERLRGTPTKLVYYSSSYVFSGLHAPYAESAVPHPVNEYGRQKLRVERQIMEKLPNALILRSTVIYGWQRHGQGSAQRLITEMRAGHSVQAPADQWDTPTYARDLADASRSLASRDICGIVHLGGPSCITRLAFAKTVAEVFGLPAALVTATISSDRPQVAARPVNPCMDTRYAQSLLGRALSAPREGLMTMREEEESGSSPRKY